MKIKIKRKLLKENKLHLYSNIWKSWKTFKDFQEWNRSQVLALAKHRKGQGKFDFRFYDKVYGDLKTFLATAEKAKVELDKEDYIWDYKKEWKENFFPKKIYRNNIFVQILSEYEFYRGGVLPLWYFEVGSMTDTILENGRLEQELKNMESLRETYPWNKKHLPTIQKYLGIYEKKIKKH